MMKKRTPVHEHSVRRLGDRHDSNDHVHCPRRLTTYQSSHQDEVYRGDLYNVSCGQVTSLRYHKSEI
ncbi:hypothetical protein PsorP6_007820 [Peronosclerospora sorghi]|uniref:Uncharacterized protein n=1 Tax=Peronosclerospora sorghi TaxID=230839 RepID=A0ACC0W6U4_9STRA|nr:hypothetical protein PsorP6_007820 [Peronosclerospora sorghi]